RSEGGEGGADGYGQLGTDMFDIRRLLRRQGGLQEADRVPQLAFDHQLVLQGADDELGASRAAANEDVGDGFVLLMFEEIDGSAQFGAEGHHQRFELALDFARHADLNAFGFGIADAQGLGQASGQSVAADGHDAAEDEFALLQEANAGVLEADI